MSRVEGRSHYRLPAEWERQSALLLTWPSPDGAWSGVLDAIEADYVKLIEATLRHQRVVLIVPRGSRRDRDLLGQGRPGLRRIELRYNDTWIRDYGPITLCRSGQRLALDFHFGGWGGKHESGLDNLVNTHLARNPLFEDIDFRQCHLEIEGGAIEPNGDGVLLINRHCMRTRLPFLDDDELDHELSGWLNLKKVLGIDIEPLPGDDTDGHIDTLARFVRRDAIVFQSMADGAATRELNGQLEALRDADGRPFELFSLPHPDDTDPDLPASYANFILINDAVVVPQYGSRFDAEALQRIGQLFPDRKIEPVPGTTLTTQGGGPHCASMQIPSNLS